MACLLLSKSFIEAAGTEAQNVHLWPCSCLWQAKTAEYKYEFEDLFEDSLPLFSSKKQKSVFATHFLNASSYFNRKVGCALNCIAEGHKIKPGAGFEHLHSKEQIHFSAYLSGLRRL